MQLGEIITLGRHRLMCGDATSRDDVMRLIGGEKVNLVLTDPPYGISIVTSGSNMKHFPVIAGDSSTKSAEKNYAITRGIADTHIIWGGNYFTDFLPVSKGWLCWDKGSRPKNYSDGELSWTNINTPLKIYRHKWNGFIREGNHVINPFPAIHPTQKPVELHMKILEDFTQSDDVILDCFGGSGTTLIACEMTGRRCLMMEISPEYCEIIAERYEKVREAYPLGLN